MMRFHMQTNSAAVLFSLSVSIGVTMVGLGIVWPILPILAAQMGVGGFVVGTIIASFNVSRTACAPFVGRFSDRMGRKSFILIGLVLYAAVSCAYLAAHSAEALIAVRLAHGFTSLLVVPIAMALAADIAPQGQLGNYMGTLNMAAMIGLGVGPTLGGVIQEHFGMPAAFYALCIVSLGTAAFVIFFVPPDRESGAVTRRTGTATFRQILADRTAFAIVLMRFFSASGQGAVYTFLPIYAHQIGMSGSRFGILLSANVFLIALMQRPVGRLADRTNPKRVVILGMFGVAVAVFCMPFSTDFWRLLVLNILMGTSTGFILPGSLVITGYLGRTMGMASLMSVTDAAYSFGMIVSPILSGVIFDALGISWVFTAGASLIAVGGVIVAVLLRNYSPPLDEGR
ncbi:major facilitator superfamily MFS_1 [Pseudodesulfovibrio mercurii]|uniref:Major facilitator superfamily MFS_1 n=2 Tax=Pseudodesulfovibrio mercurii TaxID=641491 RepID=F0JF11_9BACT|nr:major facilitator superfamily MFS_1 [Pseudodesulfovibrio mercurii]